MSPSQAVRTPVSSMPCPVEWIGDRDGHLRLLDQTLLPQETRYLDVRGVPELVVAIRRLAVRGAPAIGVAAAYGVCLGLAGRTSAPPAQRVAELCATLASARPTAVNLFWALERMEQRARVALAGGAGEAELPDVLLAEARAIHREDAEQCRRMGELGAALVPDGGTILTHCNAGALATGGMGTALAPIYVAHEQGRKVHVFADETRPLLQGARLTAWELSQAGIGVTLITDGMAGRVMSEGLVQAVFVGADRIAANGDVCNKVGTYSVAVLARHHGLPFYVVAPTSTFDPRVATGREIPIEQRDAHEVTDGFGRRTAPLGIEVYNPAFDVTPAALVTAIVTEAGVLERPSRASVDALLRARGHLALRA